jgi:hypothetical protein
LIDNRKKERERLQKGNIQKNNIVKEQQTKLKAENGQFLAKLHAVSKRTGDLWQRQCLSHQRVKNPYREMREKKEREIEWENRVRQMMESNKG